MSCGKSSNWDGVRVEEGHDLCGSPTWDGDSVPYACRQTPDQGVEKMPIEEKSYFIYRMMIIIFGILYITGKNAQTGRSR